MIFHAAGWSNIVLALMLATLVPVILLRLSYKRVPTIARGLAHRRQQNAVLIMTGIVIPLWIIVLSLPEALYGADPTRLERFYGGASRFVAIGINVIGFVCLVISLVIVIRERSAEKAQKLR